MVRFGLRGVLSLLLIAGAAAVETGRWRYGSISWRRKYPLDPSSRKVIFSVETAWRYSHGSMVKFGTDEKAQAGDTIKILASDGQDPLFAFGDGNVTARFDVQVVNVDPIQDLLVGKSSFEWDYWAPADVNGPWEATLTLCCRVAENQNGMKSILVASHVDLSDPAVHGSPRVRIIPRLALQAFGAGDIQHFEVPATAAEGYEGRGDIVWEDASADFYFNLVSFAPNASQYLGVNRTTGLASVDVRCYKHSGCTQDLHVMIKVSRAGVSGMVDFIVRVQKNAGADAIPALTMKAPVNNPFLNGMESGALRGLPVVDAYAEFPVVLTFKGKDAQQQEVFFEYNMLPIAAVLAAKRLVDPLDVVYAQEIQWTPSPDQVGEHYICGVAFDRDPQDACSACTPDLENDETTCVPLCPVHFRSKPLCFNVRVFPNGSPIFSAPANTPVATNLTDMELVRATDEQVIDMNFPFEILVAAGDSNWMDPVTLAVHGVHPDGSSIVAGTGQLATFIWKWTPSRAFGGWSQVFPPAHPPIPLSLSSSFGPSLDASLPSLGSCLPSPPLHPAVSLYIQAHRHRMSVPCHQPRLIQPLPPLPPSPSPFPPSLAHRMYASGRLILAQQQRCCASRSLALLPLPPRPSSLPSSLLRYPPLARDSAVDEGDCQQLFFFSLVSM